MRFSFAAGMQALFEIKKCFPNVHKPRPHGELREFFIAAEEEVWDYAPAVPSERLVSPCAHKNSDRNDHMFLVKRVKKKFFMFVCSEAETFVTRGPKRIGSRYKKARYVEYTDNTFTTKMLRSPEEQHLGILGNSS